MQTLVVPPGISGDDLARAAGKSMTDTRKAYMVSVKKGAARGSTKSATKARERIDKAMKFDALKSGDILAIDQGSALGWAESRGGILTWGCESFAPGKEEARGFRWIKFNSWLERHCRGSQGAPDLIVYEQAHHRGGAPTEVAYGFITRIHEACARFGIEYIAFHRSSVKAHALGPAPKRKKSDPKFDSGKPAMHAAAIKRLQDFGLWTAGMKLTQDEADALWLLWMAQERRAY